MSSVSMASNKGGHHKKGHRTEVIVRYENDRDCDYRDRDYRDGDRYVRHDNRRYDGYNDDYRYYEKRHRKDRCRRDRCYECRHHHNSNAKVAGAVLGTAALILLTSH